MSLFTKKSVLIVALFTCALIGIQGCGDGNTISGPDFSSVPPAWDANDADSTISMSNGLTIHILEEGSKVLPPVTVRDQVSLRYTGRTEDGTVFTSSYANGNTSPATFSNLTPTAIGNTPSLIEGFRLGLLGMYEGEQRKIIIPPSLGYGDSRRGTNGFDLRNETLIYDVELVRIAG
ncbi:FKBP-type peptidyl-prolyl cis-trans isomerase [Aliifodinibius sp. S!AR15-10]|uniref:FKBP-type peptidyl-prolyl cis-trans isomerase n=1 Tax=Aliifodinibius sp. S!AR15-10 TaxID=2950437 RepID=UPI002862B3B1|nr:FKBP-type peptidyl-prolyl cis-trans isomerase [Aliifodinibius sp. S!AR15-10]MDR8392740.1 FKBP-type peptidyl-prolyl cis-trans isomerase [Aliifodinibius sp. S!AR15-10]